MEQRASERESVNAASIAQITALYHQGKEIGDSIERLATDFAQWNVEYTSIMSSESEEGKKIAASSVLLQQFMSAVDQAALSQEDVDSWQDQLKELMTPVERAYRAKDATTTANKSLVEKLNALEEEVERAVATLRQTRAAVSAIRKQAAAQDLVGEGAGIEAAITAELEKRALEDIRLREERLAQARAEMNRQLTDAQIEAEKLINAERIKTAKALGQVERKRIADATEDQLREERERAEERAAQLAREQLEAEFKKDESDIQTYLLAFTEHGFKQPSRRGYVTERTERPVSLAALRGMGALAPTIQGLAALNQAARVCGRRAASTWPNLRASSDGTRLGQGGLGIYPVAPDQKFLQRAQDLLIKYGDLMVEKKMLAE